MVLFSGSLKIKCMCVLCQTLCSIIKSKKGSQLEYMLNSDCCKISFYTDKAHGEIILKANTTIMIDTTRGYNACVEYAMARTQQWIFPVILPDVIPFQMLCM